MSILSRTNYHLQSISDTGGAVTAFTRASVKTNYDTGVDTQSGLPQFQQILVAPYQNSAAIDDSGVGESVQACAADKNGRIWGISDNGTKLYILDPSGANAWTLVKDFGIGQVTVSIHCSQKSGYIFVGVNSKVYRSVMADGTDDFVEVLSMLGVGANMNFWSFTDAPDGRVWISEYGGAKAGDEDDAIRIYRSLTEGAAGSFTVVFNFFNDPNVSADFHAGIHIHKIIYNHHNEVLYMSHGDTAPRYMYKSLTGSGGNWQRLAYRFEYRTGLYIDMAATSGVVLPDGNILWGNDIERGGLYFHDVSSDDFTFINVGGYYNASAFYDMKLIHGIIYATQRVEQTTRVALIAIDSTDIYNNVYLDYGSAVNPNGTLTFAGLGNDGYVYGSYYDGAGDVHSKKWRQVINKNIYGLTIDAANNNLLTDPFGSVGINGWSTYAAGYYTAIGGKYKDAYFTANAQYSNKFVISNLIDAVVVSVWCKIGNVPASAINLYVKLQFFDGADASLGYTNAVNMAYYGSYSTYFVKFSALIPVAGCHADTVKARLQISGGGNIHFDCAQVEQTSKQRLKLCGFASYAADSITNTLTLPIPSTCTISGITSVRYQFDTVGTYAFFSAKNAASDKWIKLVQYNGQMMLIDDANPVGAPIITTAIGVPFQRNFFRDGDPPPDIYYWSLRFYDDAGTPTVALDVASQRSNVESPAPVAYTPAADLIIMYDGCSHTAGEEIGGAVLWREVQSAELSLADIQTLWDSQPTAGGGGLSPGLGLSGGNRPPWWNRRR